LSETRGSAVCSKLADIFLKIARKLSKKRDEGSGITKEQFTFRKQKYWCCTRTIDMKKFCPINK
jgi:hypothetical protein